MVGAKTVVMINLRPQKAVFSRLSLIAQENVFIASIIPVIIKNSIQHQMKHLPGEVVCSSFNL